MKTFTIAALRYFYRKLKERFALNQTFTGSGEDAGAGLVPAPPNAAGTTKYLREDGTWQVPPDTDTTYSNMAAATASAAGSAGLVPAPAAGEQAYFLRGDGTWAVPPDTDTHRTTHLYAGSGSAANAATTNGNTKLSVADNSAVRNSVTIKGTGATSVTSDASGNITVNSTNTTYSNFVKSGSGAAAGLVPSPGTTAGTTKYLREDGTWQVPPDTDTTYSNMAAATASAAGSAGLVPAPAAGEQAYFLRGDGTWAVPPDTDTHRTTHLYAGSGSAANAATTNGNTKLSVADNSAVRNSVTIKGTGATSVTSDASGNITVNSTNTTYSNFVKSGSGAAAGLVPSPGTTAGTTKYLREDGTWQVIEELTNAEIDAMFT